MSEFRFIHAADIHLDSPLKGLERYEGAPIDEIREATRRAFQNLVSLAIDQQVAFVLLAGDIYDGDWKDHNTGLFFVSQLTRLHDAGISVYAISGNHDAENKMTRTLRLPANPNGTNVMLSARKPQTVLLDDIDVAIHGRGFMKAKETENLAVSYPPAMSGKFNIGMLHTALNGKAGHEPYAPCTISDLTARQYQYWALGHVHNRGQEHRVGETPIIFPGNIQGRHIRETGPKGCEIVSVNSGGDIELTFAPLDVFRWEHCRVDATNADTTADIMDTFADELQKLVAAADGRPLAVRVQVLGATASHTELVAEQEHWIQEFRAQAMTAGGSDVWVEKVCFETTPLRDRTQDDMDSGPVAELLNYFADLQDDEVLLHEINGELDDLRRKLPDELVRGDDPVVPADSDQLRCLLETVRPLLMHRLMGEEAVQ